MKKSRYTEEQIAYALRQAELGTPVAELPTEPVAIFGASGGLALLRRTMLDDSGPFAGDFFCYLEDADLAWRARLRGCAGPPSPSSSRRTICGSGWGARCWGHWRESPALARRMALPARPARGRGAVVVGAGPAWARVAGLES